MPDPNLAFAWGFVRALAVGFLIGAERESRQGSGGAVPGIRDFMLIALTGSIASFLNSPVVTVVGMSGIVAIIVARRLKTPAARGITTELAALVTYWLGFLAHRPETGALAMGGAVAVTIILMIKAPITHLVKDVVSRGEVYDTIKFLAVVFIVYPLLPEGAYGPYDFFAPRTVWKFVILVSSVSYVGYFLTKFMSEGRGLLLTSLLGGLVSTTATTISFAGGARSSPERWREYGWATVLSNAVQFPRIAVIVYAMSPALAAAASGPLAAMCGAGLLFGLVLARSAPRGPAAGAAGATRARPILKNPFALGPALKFGVVFTAILFLARFGSAQFGDRGTFTSSFLGGLIDVDAVSISLAELVRGGQFSVRNGVMALLLTLLANAIFKAGAAVTGGTRSFGRAVGLSFAVMLAAGLAATLVFVE